MVCSSSLLPAPGMPASRPRRPSVRAGSIENGRRRCGRSGRGEPVGGRAPARRRGRRASASGSPSSSSSEHPRRDAVAVRARVASRTGPAARATSSAQSRWTPSAATSSSVVAGGDVGQRAGARPRSSASAIVVHLARQVLDRAAEPHHRRPGAVDLGHERAVERRARRRPASSRRGLPVAGQPLEQRVRGAVRRPPPARGRTCGSHFDPLPVRHRLGDRHRDRQLRGAVEHRRLGEQPARERAPSGAAAPTRPSPRRGRGDRGAAGSGRRRVEPRLGRPPQPRSPAGLTAGVRHARRPVRRPRDGARGSRRRPGGAPTAAASSSPARRRSSAASGWRRRSAALLGGPRALDGRDGLLELRRRSARDSARRERALRPAALDVAPGGHRAA